MKVCIIGNGLTSLALAKALVNRDIFVDVFYEQNTKKYNITRTLGISESNTEYFSKNILDIKKILWNIKKIKIFTENSFQNEIINFSNHDKPLFSILQNDRLYKLLEKNLKKNKFFCYKKNFIYTDTTKKRYNLIINCDSNNKITKKFFSKKLEKNYDSYAYTTIIEHKKLSSNSTAIQTFTNGGPIAFLPINNNKTSVVYSLKNNKQFSEDQVLKLIKQFNPKYKIKRFNILSKFVIKSSNLRNYYFHNILAFGDLLHKLHPLAGQGFNMSIRDIKVLIDLIDERIKIGLNIDSSICVNFQKRCKDKNYLFSKGIDLIYEFFNFESKINNQFLTSSVKSILKNKSFNNFFKKIANIGIRI